MEELYRRFYQDTTNTAALAVILDFELGARVGEVAALQFSDIEGNYIHVQRQEIKEYDAVDGITWRFKQRKVAEYTKSEAGDRYIYLTETARAVIGLIQTTNPDKQTENLIEGALNCDIYSSRVNTLHAVKERVQTVPRQSPVHFCGKGIKIIPFPQE